MNDEAKHIITIVCTGIYVHGSPTPCEVKVRGDGSIDHALDAFQAALVAMGFSTETAGRLQLREPGHE